MLPTTLRNWTVASAAVIVLASQSATAIPIIGGITFSDGLTTLSGTSTAIVSDLTAISPGATTLAQACGGLFATGGACIPSSGTFASAFTLTSPIPTQIVYTYNGFVFTVSSLAGAINRSGLVCGGTTCSDSLSFTGTGTVTGPGNLEPSLFTMVWSATGTCTAGAAAAACLAGSASGTWVARVTALAEPGTLVLLGLGILLIGFVRRSVSR